MSTPTTHWHGSTRVPGPIGHCCEPQDVEAVLAEVERQCGARLGMTASARQVLANIIREAQEQAAALRALPTGDEGLAKAWDEGLNAGFDTGAAAARREVPVPFHSNPYNVAEQIRDAIPTDATEVLAKVWDEGYRKACSDHGGYSSCATGDHGQQHANPYLTTPPAPTEETR